MKLSVALCTYNGGAYLSEQLESIATQTRPPDELVVCDDRSGDNSSQIVREFGRRAGFPVRLYVNETNMGSTKNFEKAISLCEGDVIALSDQDDVWRADKLRRTEDVLLTRPEVGFVFADGELVDERLRPLGQSLWQSIKFGAAEQRRIESDKAFDLLLPRVVVTGATLAFRAKFKQLILPIPVSFNQEDLVFLHDGWISLLLSAVSRAALVRETLFKYRQHPDQQVGAKEIKGNLAAGLKADAKVPGRLIRSVYRKNPFAAQIDLLRAVRERMLEQRGAFDLREPLAKVQGRLAHLVARSNLPASKTSRLPVVLREILTLRYFHYSNGMYSAAKDLLS